MRSPSHLILTLCALATTALAHGAGKPTSTPTLPTTSSWIGNSFGGAANKYVPNSAEAMIVLPDGTCATNVPWEEGGGNVTLLKNNDVVGRAGHTHGWGYEGGYAIAANASHYFIAQRVEHCESIPPDPARDLNSWPAKGRNWYGVSRRLRSNIALGAPFAGGKGGNGDTVPGSFLVVDEVVEKAPGAQITGLVATTTELFVADGHANKIRVYDQGTMAFKREWECARPGHMAIDGGGYVWIVQKADGASAQRIGKYDQKGVAQGVQITFASDVLPQGIAYDDFGRANQLMVCDAGPDQNVKIYHLATLAGSPTTVTATFGVTGGYLQGSGGAIGTVGNLRFFNPIACGVDSSGAIYVASRQVGGTFGLQIEKYNRAGTTLSWSLKGMTFIDTAVVDPASESGDLIHAYTKDERYQLDLSKPAGQEWTLKSCTINPVKYPADSRVTPGAHAVRFVNFQGGKFLVVADPFANLLQLYRYNASTDGEIAIPSYSYSKKSNGFARWVDDQCNIWEGTGPGAPLQTIYKTPCTGKDASGNPIYGEAVTFPLPAPFTDVRRLQYDPATDTMYVAGFSAAHPETANATDEWKSMGRVLARYDHWSGSRNKVWEILLPYDKNTVPVQQPVSMVQCGDYVFVVGVFTQTKVWAYKAGSGAFVGHFLPGGDVGTVNDTGWVDVTQGISAHRRPNGEYLVFVEEDLRAKVLMYRWIP